MKLLIVYNVLILYLSVSSVVILLCLCDCVLLLLLAAFVANKDIYICVLCQAHESQHHCGRYAF